MLDLLMLNIMEILFQPQERFAEILLMEYIIDEKVDFLQLMKSDDFGTARVGVERNLETL